MSENAKTEIELTPRSAWEIYDSAEHRAAMDELAGRYLDFLTRCKTERETVEYLTARLEAAGFSTDPASPSFYRVQHGKTLIAVRQGKKPLSEGFRLVGSHADTPRLDLKQRPLFEEVQVGLAKTHYYGGIRKHQWLGRPLALHGIIVKKSGEVVRVCLGEEASDPVLMIADLLPHLAHKQNELKLADAFDAEKLNVIVGHAPADKPRPDGEAAAPSGQSENGEDKPAKPSDKLVKKRVLGILAERYGITEEDLYSAELQIVPAGPARPVGLDASMIGGYGQDDRICVFASLEALLAEPEPAHTQLAIFWDKEEIGSEGATSARSLFLEYTVDELIDAWSPGARLSQVMERSKALSADVHAAIDPDWQELHEKLNAALLGYGPVFSKFTGHRGKIGASDARPEYVAWLRSLLSEAGVPWQMAELGRVDLGGGGTIAKHVAIYGMDIIDFGPALLSMHSPFELSSKVDLYATWRAFRAFFKS